jgi:hypothetical protein
MVEPVSGGIEVQVDALTLRLLRGRTGTAIIGLPRVLQNAYILRTPQIKPIVCMAHGK